MDIEWILDRLDEFLRLTDKHPHVKYAHVGSNEDIQELSAVIELILDRNSPGWKETTPTYASSFLWETHRQASIRARELLLKKQEIAEKLGENAPEISAAKLHPWVWNGAASLWQSAHYREAVEAAIKKVNAETQNRVMRRDLSETELFENAFSLNKPKETRTHM